MLAVTGSSLRRIVALEEQRYNADSEQAGETYASEPAGSSFASGPDQKIIGTSPQPIPHNQ